MEVSHADSRLEPRGRGDLSPFSFHHEWISEINRALNRGLLPPDYYAMAEQVAAGFGPDVLTLQDQTIAPASYSGGIATQTRPKTTYYTELPGEFKQRRKSLVAVRHVSGDHIVAMIEIVSPGNKNCRRRRRLARHAALSRTGALRHGSSGCHLSSGMGHRPGTLATSHRHHPVKKKS
jgi:hypothetical protein